jgi:D-beta-D-heptose 7-phosphate kinase/D-beta-D-heptose 1-phosphate adenosyltransferase
MKHVWTNGCFDILHLGHIKLFQYAKSIGDKLIVGIDSDDRIRKNKGNNRPINSEKNRLDFLSSIKFIDKIVIFDNDEELCNELIKNNIDTIVIGDEYKYKKVIGKDIVNHVLFFPKLYDLSTTKILGSMNE